MWNVLKAYSKISSAMLSKQQSKFNVGVWALVGGLAFGSVEFVFLMPVRSLIPCNMQDFSPDFGIVRPRAQFSTN